MSNYGEKGIELMTQAIMLMFEASLNPNTKTLNKEEVDNFKKKLDELSTKVDSFDKLYNISFEKILENEKNKYFNEAFKVFNELDNFINDFSKLINSEKDVNLDDIKDELLEIKQDKKFALYMLNNDKTTVEQIDVLLSVVFGYNEKEIKNIIDITDKFDKCLLIQSDVEEEVNIKKIVLEEIVRTHKDKTTNLGPLVFETKTLKPKKTKKLS